MPLSVNLRLDSTDYPFPLGESEPGKMIESMSYDDAIKSMLLHGTALNWLDLDASRFTSE